MSKRILFVDDESNVLQGIKRMLRPMRHEWDMQFAQSGQEALELLSQTPFDVIVSDMRMPGMDGAELLSEVMKRYPDMVRIILSGHAKKENILRSVGPTHQFLSKPCDAEVMKSTLARACALRELLSDAKIMELTSQMDSLPSLPSLYTELVKEVQSPNSSTKKIGEIISQDVGMSAKILQLVNSGFFGLRQQIFDPAQAVVYLGFDTVKALVLFAHIFSEYDQAKFSFFSIEDLWSHSMAVGTSAKLIAKTEGADKIAIEEAFTAGVLHDIGKLVLATNLPEKYKRVMTLMTEQKITLWEAELSVFSATHAKVGAYLLGLWGLPDPIVEAVAYHHNPNDCLDEKFSPLTAVYAANILQHEIKPQEEDEILSQFNCDYLHAIGLSDRLDKWRQICSETDQKGVSKNG